MQRNDRDQSRNVGRSHSHVELEPLGAGGLGNHGDTVLLFFGLWREEVLGRWSLGLQLTKTKRPRVSPLIFNDFSAGCLKFF